MKKILLPFAEKVQIALPAIIGILKAKRFCAPDRCHLTRSCHTWDGTLFEILKSNTPAVSHTPVCKLTFSTYHPLSKWAWNQIPQWRFPNVSRENIFKVIHKRPGPFSKTVQVALKNFLQGLKNTIFLVSYRIYPELELGPGSFIAFYGERIIQVQFQVSRNSGQLFMFNQRLTMGLYGSLLVTC